MPLADARSGAEFDSRFAEMQTGGRGRLMIESWLVGICGISRHLHRLAAKGITAGGHVLCLIAESGKIRNEFLRRAPLLDVGLMVRRL